MGHFVIFSFNSGGCGALVSDTPNAKTRHCLVCVNEPIACIWAAGGCTFKSVRGEMTEHESDLRLHVMMLMVFYMNIFHVFFQAHFFLVALSFFVILWDDIFYFLCVSYVFLVF